MKINHIIYYKLSPTFFFILASLLLFVGCSSNKEGNSSDSASEKQPTIESRNNEEMPNFSFCLEGVLEVQPNKINEINLIEYLPKENYD